MGGMSSKILKAKYDAAQNVLRLVEPLEGVANEADVKVTVAVDAPAQTPAEAWEAIRRDVTQEQLDELAAVIEEMFPIEK